MTALILDTSCAHTLLALTQNGKLIDSTIYLHQNKLSSLLTTSIQNILKKHALSTKDLQYVGVGIGPGSYTGTRVGVAVAKSLSLGLEIPLVSFCSLLAYVPENTAGNFGFLMETKQGAPFLLESCAEIQGFSSILWRLLPQPEEGKNIFKSIPYFALDPESFHKAHPDYLLSSPMKAEPSLYRLCLHLQDEYTKGKGLSYFQLDTLELLYLHSIAIPLIPAEALIEAPA